MNLSEYLRVLFAVGVCITACCCEYRPFDEISYQCEKCECCRGGCNLTTGICEDPRQCQEGYWGEQGYKDGGNDGDCRHACHNTKPPCVSCNIRTGKVCYSCTDGFYVTHMIDLPSNCTLKCWSGCQACKAYASHCTSCKPGFFGPLSGCARPCHSNCVKCNDNSSCSECPSGKHGILCELDCPTNCVNCSSTTECTLCKNGYYGQTCQYSCERGCKAANCGIKDGNCSPCVIGLYGDQCSQQCSFGCLDLNCNQSSGLCVNGCKETYSGDKCCVNGSISHCKTCQSNRKCAACENGFYGDTCAHKCPINCISSECRKESGHCYECSPNRYGGTCESVCSENCFIASSANISRWVCDSQTGACDFGCVKGFYGYKCSETCSQGCVDLSCNQHNGHCECIEGRSGDTCETVEMPLKSAFFAVSGTLVVVALVMVVILFICLRRKKNESRSEDNSVNGNEEVIQHPSYANLQSKTDKDDYIYNTIDNAA